MATTWMTTSVFIFHVITTFMLVDYADSFDSPTFPKYLQGEYYSEDNGESVLTTVTDVKWGDMFCNKKFDHPKPDPKTEGANHTFELYDSITQKYFCLDVLWRNSNVLQFLKSNNTIRTINGRSLCEAVRYGLPNVDQLTTMFRIQSPNPGSCNSNFNGIWQFRYGYKDNDGYKCNKYESQIKACKDPASKFPDSNVIQIRFAKCHVQLVPEYDTKNYYCLGTWMAFDVVSKQWNTYAAIANLDEDDPADKFRCMMSSNYLEEPNSLLWVMSQTATCKQLDLFGYSHELEFVLTKLPILGYDPTSKCKSTFQKFGEGQYSGVWVDEDRTERWNLSNVTSDGSHIYFSTLGHETQESVAFSCQYEIFGTNLMYKVDPQNCEVEYRCFYFTSLNDTAVELSVDESYMVKLDFLSEDDIFNSPTIREIDLYEKLCHGMNHNEKLKRMILTLENKKNWNKSSKDLK